jgi:2-methylcitrate dehydratase PrpD
MKRTDSRMTRRRMIGSGAGLLAAAAVPLRAQSASTRAEPPSAEADLTGRVARYMAAAREQTLAADVVREAKHRILDTIAAMISGARLKPGEMAIRFARAQGGTPEASIVTTDIRSSVINAALVNAMFAHADETDDFEPVTKAHPGCSAVPAALAVGERENASGQELIRAVVLGYDLGCRWLQALGPNHVRATHRSAEGVSATMGAAAAAASMARLDEKGMRYALSYAVQQVSGVWSWERDLEHVEKAFDFAGMGARNGVTAAMMAQAGFSGVPDVLEGEHNGLEAHSTQPRPEEMAAGLGRRFYVTETAIKTFSVGYPIQSALDAVLTLRREHSLTPANVDRVVVRLPEDGAGIVNDSAMPDVNLQYLIAVALIDGTVSFDASHSFDRMKDQQVLGVKQRVQLVGDRALMDPAAPRSANVDVHLRDSRTVTHFTRFAPGTKENPLDTAAVAEKARSLIAPVLGAQRSQQIIERVNGLDTVVSVRDLVRLLVA